MELPPAPKPIRRNSDERLMRFYFASSGGPPIRWPLFLEKFLFAAAWAEVLSDK
jgi:hypothetical protein